MITEVDLIKLLWPTIICFSSVGCLFKLHETQQLISIDFVEMLDKKLNFPVIEWQNGLYVHIIWNLGYRLWVF